MSLNPFDEDAAPMTEGREAWLDRLAATDVEEVHAEAQRRISEAFTRAMGEVESEDSEEGEHESSLILLRAPRAGYGKTHLLARVASGAPDHTLFFPVEFRPGAAGWSVLLRGFVNHLTETGDGALGKSLSRRLVGELVARLIERGDLAAKHAESAVPLLRKEAATIFAKNGEPNAAVEWLSGNFSGLRPILVKELARAAGFTDARAEFWFDVLRGFDTPNAETRQAARLRAMFLPESEETAQAARERVIELCVIAGMLAPVAVFADQLDTLYGDPETGRRVAVLFEELQELAPGTVIVLSMNRDVWDSAFGAKLPSALEDRFTANAIDLEPIGRTLLEKIVRRRCEVAGVDEKEIDELMKRADVAITISDSPRSAIRHARHWWDSPAEAAVESREDERESDEDDEGGIQPFLLGPSNGDDEPAGDRGKPWEDFLEEEVEERPAPWADDLTGGKEDAGRPEEAPPISDRAAREPFEPFSSSASDGFEVDPRTEPPAVRRFRELQGDLLSQREKIIMDAETLRQIIRLTGQASPLVEVSEKNLNGSTHPRTADAVTCWSFPESEIIFSFRSLAGDVGESWNRLSQFVESMNGTGPSKVVVFADGTLEDPPEFPWLDVVDLDGNAKATLMAAGIVLAESASSHEALDEAFRQIAPHLDPFWRRITRPLPAGK